MMYLSPSTGTGISPSIRTNTYAGLWLFHRPARPLLPVHGEQTGRAPGRYYLFGSLKKTFTEGSCTGKSCSLVSSRYFRAALLITSTAQANTVHTGWEPPHNAEKTLLESLKIRCT